MAPARPRVSRPAARLLVVGALVATAAACTGSDDTETAPTVVTTTTIAPDPRVDDGVLRIGALIPVGDTLIGTSLDSAARDAVEAINEAGGALGSDVELVVEDEGATAATASAAIGSLVADGVDAIVGPSSSLTALGALDDAVAAGIVTCSPTATAIALDDFPDERLFFRSVPADSLQAEALAELADNTGERRVAVVFVDDAYGRPYAEAVTDALDGRQLTVDSIAIPAGVEDFSSGAVGLVDSGADVAIVVGAAGDAARFLDALGQLDFSGLSTILVNDAARDTVVRPVISALPGDLRDRIVGVAPQITIDSDEDAVPFAPQVVDCVNLLALSAIQADSDSPTAIAQQMPSASAGGSVCDTFADCVADLDAGRQIDYNGPTGNAELNREGQTSRARFDVFQFAADGSDSTVRSVTVRS